MAAFHVQHDGYAVTVATSDQIYNEFSSATPDPTALRDFVKMYFDKAGNDSTLRPKYLLLFGAASFDYKNRISNNSNLVPCYESLISVDPLATYTSDDFFGLFAGIAEASDVDGAIVVNVNVGAGFFFDFFDDFAARPDDHADLVRFDVH